MLTNLLIDAITLSIDSIGVGVAYGIRNIKISFISILLLFIISFALTFISAIIGGIIFNFLPVWFPNILGCLLLSFMGFWIIFQSLKQSNGITEILNDPSLSDFNNSKTIEFKEAICIGLAMSIDSLICGVRN